MRAGRGNVLVIAADGNILGSAYASVERLFPRVAEGMRIHQDRLLRKPVELTDVPGQVVRHGRAAGRADGELKIGLPIVSRDNLLLLSVVLN